MNTKCRFSLDKTRKNKQGTLRFKLVKCLARFIVILHIHRHTGLKFHSEFTLVDSDLFNQPPDQMLVVFGNGGGMFAQAVNLIGDIFVVGLGAGQLQKLRLQFLQPVVNVGEDLIVFPA